MCLESYIRERPEKSMVTHIDRGNLKAPICGAVQVESVSRWKVGDILVVA